MGSHIDKNGKFQSDKYPSCPASKVPLSVEDPTAQDLLWEYANRRRSVDAEFSEDLKTALLDAGYLSEKPKGTPAPPARVPFQVGQRVRALKVLRNGAGYELRVGDLAEVTQQLGPRYGHRVSVKWTLPDGKWTAIVFIEPEALEPV